MKPTRLFGLLAAFASLVFQVSAAEPAASKPLRQIFDTEWEYHLSHHPSFASRLGDRRFNDRWEDLSLEAINKDHLHNQTLLKTLRAIQSNKLNSADRINYQIFLRQCELDDEAFQFRGHLIPLDQREGIQALDDSAEGFPFTTIKDYEDWIARLRGIGNLMDQTIALMREGLKVHIVQPRVTMQRVPGQIEKQIVSEPAKSPFYKPMTQIPGSIPEDAKTRLQAAARQAIQETVIPAYTRFKSFFVNEYIPGCYEGVGAWHLPGGDQYYAFLVRRFTTTEQKPAEVHAIGLKEVARIRAEMEAIKIKTGFKGTLKQFFQYLRTEKSFYYSSPQELLTAYRAMAKTIDPKLVKVIKTLPRNPYGVEPVPDKMAPDTTTAYYNDGAADGSRPGTYYVNLYRPETRPKYEMMALSLHESVPGHHTQIARAMELGDLPAFRRYGGETAYVEGWALYAESLGEDMGLYDDPYSKFGQLTYEMWRAVRLVVDTGIHSMHWDRQKAIDYFLDNAAKSELDVTNEVDRYISWPGQALAYKTGELKIKELRARATKALGTKFSLPEFNDAVLECGAVPLSVLESHIDEFIAAHKK